MQTVYDAVPLRKLQRLLPKPNAPYAVSMDMGTVKENNN